MKDVRICRQHHLRRRSVDRHHPPYKQTKKVSVTTSYSHRIHVPVTAKSDVNHKLLWREELLDVARVCGVLGRRGTPGGDIDRVFRIGNSIGDIAPLMRCSVQSHLMRDRDLEHLRSKTRCCGEVNPIKGNNVSADDTTLT